MHENGFRVVGKTVEDVLLEMVGLCESFSLSYAILGGPRNKPFGREPGVLKNWY